MPRTFRRNGTRRYKRKTLSKSAVYSRTSARSQARQIYALKRRVSSLSRSVRPELKIKDFSPETFDLHNAAWTNSYQSYTLQWPSQGDEPTERVGAAFRIKALQIRLNLEYYNDSTTGYHAGESAGTPVRIIVIRTVGPVTASFTTSLDTLLQHSGYSNADYTARSISPFKRAVTEQYKILADKTITLTSDKNQQSVYFSVGHGQRIEYNTSGQAHHYLVYVAPAGLHYDADFKEHVSGIMVYRVVYTDV